MEKRQDDKLGMAQTVKLVCDAERPVWAGLPGLKRGIATLGGYNASLCQLQASARDGVLPTKKKINDNMTEQSLLVAGAICSAASEMGNVELSTAFDLNARDIDRIRENLHDNKAQAIHDKGRALLSAEQRRPRRPPARPPTKTTASVTPRSSSCRAASRVGDL